MVIRFLIALAGLFIAQNVWALPRVIRPKVDKTKIHIGDVIRYSLQFTRNKDAVVNVPEKPPFGDFTILSKEQFIRKLHKSGQLEETFVFHLAIYKPGTFLIPSFKIPFRGVDLKTGVAAIQDVKIEVMSLIKPAKKPKSFMVLKGIKPPVPIRERDYTFLYLLIALAGTALAGSLSYVIYRFGKKRGRRERPLPPPPPPRPAHEIALERLAAIEADRLLDQGLVKEYTSRVSDALREYLGNRYGFDSLEMTSTEVLEELRESQSFPRLRYNEVLTFLNDCDLVKFAKMLPGMTDCQRYLTFVYYFVEQTKLMEHVADSAFHENKLEARPGDVVPPLSGPAAETSSKTVSSHDGLSKRSNMQEASTMLPEAVALDTRDGEIE